MMSFEVYPYDPETLARLRADTEAAEKALREAVREALIVHKKLGQWVVSYEDGQVVWVPPEDIPYDVNELPAQPPPPGAMIRKKSSG